MKDYHEFGKTLLGGSDAAEMVLLTSKNNYPIHFGEDGDYSAYFVSNTTTVPDYYKLVQEINFNINDNNTILIVNYENSECSRKITGEYSNVKIYRAGDYGCIFKFNDSFTTENEFIEKVLFESLKILFINSLSAEQKQKLGCCCKFESEIDQKVGYYFKNYILKALQIPEFDEEIYKIEFNHYKTATGEMFVRSTYSFNKGNVFKLGDEFIGLGESNGEKTEAFKMINNGHNYFDVGEEVESVRPVFTFNIVENAFNYIANIEKLNLVQPINLWDIFQQYDNFTKACAAHADLDELVEDSNFNKIVNYVNYEICNYKYTLPTGETYIDTPSSFISYNENQSKKVKKETGEPEK